MKALGKSTLAAEYVLRHAELNQMTFAGAEAALIQSGKLEAYLNTALHRA